MKVEDLLNILHLTMTLGMFANGLNAMINPLFWYDSIYAILFFIFTAICIYYYPIILQSSSEGETP